jgi:hypothetical protein
VVWRREAFLTIRNGSVGVGERKVRCGCWTGVEMMWYRGLFDAAVDDADVERRTRVLVIVWPGESQRDCTVAWTLASPTGAVHEEVLSANEG